MAQATLINKTGQKVVVESGSQDAKNYFGQGYSLMQAPKKTTSPTIPQSALTPANNAVKDISINKQLGTDKLTGFFGSPTYDPTVLDKQANSSFLQAVSLAAKGASSDAEILGLDQKSTVRDVLTKYNLGSLAPNFGIKGDTPAVTDTQGKTAENPVLSAYDQLISQKTGELGQTLDINQYNQDKITANNELEKSRQTIVDKELIDNVKLDQMRGQPIMMSMIQNQQNKYTADQHIDNLMNAQDYNNKLILSKMAEGNFLEAMKINQDIADDNFEIQKLQIDRAKEQGRITEAEQARLDAENNYQRTLATSGYTYISDPKKLAGLKEEQLFRDPVNGKIYLKPSNDVAAVSAMQQKYPDAGILSTDNIATATAKLKNSAIYRKDTSTEQPSPGELLDADEKNLVWNGSGWTSKTAGQVVSPSGHTYDMSTYNAPGGQNYITSLQNSINSIGKINSEEELANYISQKMPNSEITARDVVAAANETGIGWEELLGLIQKEAPGGASPVSIKNNNFGGITASSTYLRSHPEASLGSSRPASEGGNYVKFPDVKSGLVALAEQLKKRDLGVSTQVVSGGLANAGILNATGLSLPAFSFLTQGTTALTRMNADQRLQYMNEAEKYLNKTGTDVATFQSQYGALAKTVEANSLRNNQASVAESELDATVENLRTAADAKEFGKLRWNNVAKLFAGKEVNDSATIKYGFHLEQLREEFAMYNAAISGQIDANGNIRQIDESDYKRAEGIIKEGLAKGGIDGFEEALNASREKMQVILQNSIKAQDKQVWKLFGVEDKYPATNKDNKSRPSLDSFEKK